MSKKKKEEPEEETQEEVAPVSGFQSSVKTMDAEEPPVPLWLITFTDIMALMLTFFVLLYTMSKPEAEKWKDMSSGMLDGFKQFYSPNFNAGSADAINVDKIDFTQALSLNYLKSRFEGLIAEEKELGDVVVILQTNRLVLSLPSELLFESGRADVTTVGKKALFALGGALSNIKNRVEIVGHADPRPIENEGGNYPSNWELSLARATNVAATLENVGYRRHMIVRGVSSARYDELPANMNEDERLALARRVDIVIHKDDGGQRLLLQLGSP